jgi:hypothetical protein
MNNVNLLLIFNIDFYSKEKDLMIYIGSDLILLCNKSDENTLLARFRSLNIELDWCILKLNAMRIYY